MVARGKSAGAWFGGDPERTKSMEWTESVEGYGAKEVYCERSEQEEPVQMARAHSALELASPNNRCAESTP